MSPAAGSGAAADGRHVLLAGSDRSPLERLRRVVAGCAGIAGVQVRTLLKSAVGVLQAGRIDLVLTTPRLIGGSGAELVRAAHARGCHSIVLLPDDDESALHAAIATGATGVLLYDDALQAMPHHLPGIWRDGAAVSPALAQRLLQMARQHLREPAVHLAASAIAAARPLLSAREVEVLSGIAKGLRYAEVADALGISCNTVRTHVRHLYRKLSVNSAVEALYEYQRRGAEAGSPAPSR